MEILKILSLTILTMFNLILIFIYLSTNNCKDKKIILIMLIIVAIPTIYIIIV